MKLKTTPTGRQSMSSSALIARMNVLRGVLNDRNTRARHVHMRRDEQRIAHRQHRRSVHHHTVIRLQRLLDQIDQPGRREQFRRIRRAVARRDYLEIARPPYPAPRRLQRALPRQDVYQRRACGARRKTPARPLAAAGRQSMSSVLNPWWANRHGEIRAEQNVLPSARHRAGEHEHFPPLLYALARHGQRRAERAEGFGHHALAVRHHVQ